MSEVTMDRGLEYFENGDYKATVECMIDCYNQGIEKEQILDFFYSNFINPNLDEFALNYQKNADHYSNLNVDECLIDFIPISDEIFYLFYKPEKVFLGSINLSEETTPKEKEIHALLISDTWDLRVMIEMMNKKQYSAVYVVIEGMEAIFSSFFKLPNITEKYLRNVELFNSVKAMEEFFINNPSKYLPWEMATARNEFFDERIDEIRAKRLEKVNETRNNIFLSICIPSYQRGTRALECVRCFTSLSYDAEIEIVVSDNGSTEDVEGYREIEKMSFTDARVKYYRLPENKLFFGNMCNLLSHAKGKHIVFSSDEDICILENMHLYLNFLLNHDDMGAGIFSGEGSNLMHRPLSKHNAGGNGIIGALNNSNYVTGMTVNNKEIQQRNILSILEKMQDNRFVSLYTHAALAVILSERMNYYESDIILFLEGKEEENKDEGKVGVLSYMHHEDRIIQQTTALQFVFGAVRLDAIEMRDIILNYFSKTFFLLELCFRLKGEEYLQIASWPEVCKYLYTQDAKYLDEINGRLPAQVINIIRSELKLIYFEYLEKNPAKPFLSKEENDSFVITVSLMHYLQDRGRKIEKMDYFEIEKTWKTAFEKQGEF